MNWQGPGTYRHFKGGLYKVLFLAKEEATGKLCAVSVCLAPQTEHMEPAGQVTVCSLEKWNELVEVDSVLSIDRKAHLPRYTYVGP